MEQPRVCNATTWPTARLVAAPSAPIAPTAVTQVYGVVQARTCVEIALVVNISSQLQPVETVFQERTLRMGQGIVFPAKKEDTQR